MTTMTTAVTLFTEHIILAVSLFFCQVQNLAISLTDKRETARN